MVICDSTGSHSLLRPLVDVLAERGLELEVLGFEQDQQAVREFGKGYAEGKVIAYALANSKLLGSADAFFKVTGRLFIANFDRLAKDVCGSKPTFNLEFGWLRQRAASAAQAWLGERGALRRQSKLGEYLSPAVSTVFWHSPKEYCFRHLLNAYLSARDRSGWYAEHAVGRTLVRHGVGRFSQYVDIVGESGTNPRFYSGGPLPEKWLADAREILRASPLR